MIALLKKNPLYFIVDNDGYVTNIPFVLLIPEIKFVFDRNKASVFISYCIDVRDERRSHTVNGGTASCP